jgi:hypothetical protein
MYLVELAAGPERRQDPADLLTPPVASTPGGLSCERAGLRKGQQR